MSRRARWAISAIEPLARVGIRSFCRLILARRVRFEVRGLELVPRSGPVVVVCRHYHHFFDAALLMTVLPRPLHFLVALDWVHSARQRRLMELLCGAARWPAVIRVEQLGGGEDLRPTRPRAYRAAEGGRYLRRAFADAIDVLRDGRALVVFPEAYPTIDPEGSPKRGPDDFLPFRPGFARLVVLAERAGTGRVPIVPAGLAYRRRRGSRGRRWRVALRLDRPTYIGVEEDPVAVAERLEQAVRALSRAECGVAS